MQKNDSRKATANNLDSQKSASYLAECGLNRIKKTVHARQSAGKMQRHEQDDDNDERCYFVLAHGGGDPFEEASVVVLFQFG